MSYQMQFKWDNAGNVESGCCGETVHRVKFEIFRKVGPQWILVHKTPYAVDGKNPQTPFFKITLSTLCNADLNAEVKIAAAIDHAG